jgi:hypothetical protein
MENFLNHYKNNYEVMNNFIFKYLSHQFIYCGIIDLKITSSRITRSFNGKTVINKTFLSIMQ